MNTEREKSILEILLKEKTVRVKELAKRLYASEPSIRRDLNSLESRHLLRRVHGGAVLDENGLSEMKIPFIIRELEQSGEKTVIAKKAADLIKDGSTVFLDASSSAYLLIPFLAKKSNLTVLSNGLKALNKLAEYNITAIATGGNIINSCLAMVGNDAFRTIRTYNADYAFFSCRGVSPDGKLTDISVEEDLVRQEMIRHAREAYLLCADDKIGKTYYHNLCSRSDITAILSNAELPESLR